MSHERIKHIKENLMACIEGQMCNIYEADAEELGEAIDMLKDLEEALYYSTITEAMEGKKHGNEYEFEMKNGGKESSQMYNRGYYPMYAKDMDDRGGRGDGNESRSGGNRPSRSYERMYEDGMSYERGGQSYERGGQGQSYARGGQGGGSGSGGQGGGGSSSGGGGSQGGGGGGSSSSNFSEMMMMRDPWEGRSPESRKMYMESKYKGHDKASQLKELEKYMQELSQDMTEMIADSSPEEKQYLEKKISALASKIGQMK